MSQNPPPLQIDYASKGESEIRKVGLAQRFVMWAVLAAMLTLIGLVPAGLLTDGLPRSVAKAAAIGLIALHLASLTMTVAGAVWLSRAMGKSITVTFITCVLLLVPVIGLIILLGLSGEATHRLKQAGVRVGLMGPKMSDLP